MRGDGEPVVRVRGLRMAYGPREVLRGVDLDVGQGEVVCLLGPNGAGKTTTLEVLEGFRVPSAGEVAVLGDDPAQRRRRLAGAGRAWCCSRGATTGGGRRGACSRASAATTRRTRRRTAPRPLPTDELLQLVGLGPHADERVGTLSGGQRRRLDVAVGIVGRPEVLFLDEPTAGLDPQGRHDVHELVHRLADLEGTTVLLTTHDLAEAERLSDRILVLAGGRIVADGSADALAREVAGRSEVRWTRGGERFVHPTDDATDFVRRLLGQHADVEDLEVRRASLEDTYLEMVRRHEQPAGDEPARGGMEVVR